MGNARFVWTDLSTFDMAQARRDCMAAFGWQFSKDPEYDFALVGADAVVALVRDPSGAGFTLYQGPDIAPPAGLDPVAERFHHLPDITLITRFYGDMFGWSFVKAGEDPWPSYTILDAAGAQIATAEEVPESIRGKFRYWMPCFQTADMEQARLGPALTPVQDLQDGRVMVQDTQGAYMMISPATC